MQDVGNFVASWLILALTVLTFSGQFLYLRLITLSLAVSFAAGAYAAATIGPGPAVPRLLIGMVGGIAAAIVGGLFDRWAGVHVRALALLASFGFVKVFQALIEISGHGGISALPIVFHTPNLFPKWLTSPVWLPTAMIGFLLFILLLGFAYRFAGLRLDAIAVGDDDDLATLFGVSTLCTSLSVQLLGGALGGFTGVLMAADAGLRPDLGFSTCIKAFGVLIATGGHWSYLLPLTVLMILAENTAAFYFGGHAREAAGFLLLGGALLLRPGIREGIRRIRRLRKTV
jgi:branched-subunit amino acid ABC-type transport system permease component